MKAEIKELWVAALESGEYTQNKGCLRKEGSFCCLGVLSDLYAKAHPDTARWEDANKTVYGDLDTFIIEEGGRQDVSHQFLDPLVADWSGLGDVYATTQTLMVQNDQEGKTFPEIAAYIRETL